jgi:cytochrome c oxidase assembly protein subunit 15
MHRSIVERLGLPIFRQTLHNPPMPSEKHSTTSTTLQRDQQAIVIWLLIVAALIFAIVVVGGITRLTRSGLSIVEWQPITGIVPPLSEQSWLAEFGKYQLSPEYLHVNSGMSLAEFKSIFYIEWAHRLLARFIFGIAVFIPLIYFIVRKRITRELLPKIIAILILGGLQGALGWIMVRTGLEKIPRVSPYALTAHLALAIGIYAYVLWVVFDLRRPQRNNNSVALSRMSWLVTSLVGLMILAGGFVAGTKAGYIFNTFPLMNGQFAPPGMYALQPWWSNLFENVATVQFNHRMIAYTLLIAALVFYWRAAKSSLPTDTRRALRLFLIAILTQIALGISTLLLIVPVWLGALHQGGALVVLSLALYLSHSLRRPTH